MQNWIIYALLSAIFATLVAIFGKIGISKNIDTTLATTVRAVIMAVFLIAVSMGLGKGNLLNTITGDNRAIAFIAFSGIAGALSWLFYFLALKTGPASGVVALDRTSVVFVFLLAVLFLSEKFVWKSALGAALITLGAILMSLV